MCHCIQYSCTLDREIRCFTLCKKSVILHKLSYTGPTLLNIGCIGRHVSSSLSDVTKRQNDVSFIQDGGHKCSVFKGKNRFILAPAPKSMQEKESNMRLWIG